MGTLAINCGSSSLKFDLFEFEGASNPTHRVAWGSIDNIGSTSGSSLAFNSQMGLRELMTIIPNHGDAARTILEWLESLEISQTIQAVGHRVVHGGDEFTLIFPDFFKLQDVDVIAKDIISACSKPLKIKNKKLILGASIGIALYPSDGDEPNTLMRNADLAMYQAKQEGKNTFRYFTDDMIKDSERRTVMEVE